jgi:hypothetical protein
MQQVLSLRDAQGRSSLFRLFQAQPDSLDSSDEGAIDQQERKAQTGGTPASESSTHDGVFDCRWY